jgi:signal transduction histidine kinase
MIVNTSSTKKIILITGGIVIALAVLLFVNAMSVGDFAQPGQGLFQGRSNVLLGISFVLLIGLAIALLFMIFLDARAPAGAPVDGVVRKPGKAAATRSKMREGENLPLAEAGGNTERQVAVLSDTAGELRNAVDAIQEGLEEILEDEAPADNEHVQSIFEETDRLKKIIDSMEQLNRVQEITRLNRKEPLQV